MLPLSPSSRLGKQLTHEGPKKKKLKDALLLSTKRQVMLLELIPKIRRREGRRY